MKDRPLTNDRYLITLNRIAIFALLIAILFSIRSTMRGYFYIYNFDVILLGTLILNILLIYRAGLHISRTELLFIAVISLFAFWVQVSTFFSPQFGLVTGSSQTWLRIPAIAWIVITSHELVYDMSDVYRVAFLLSLIVGLVSLLQFFTKSAVGTPTYHLGSASPSLITHSIGTERYIRAIGPFTNPNRLGIFIGTLLPLLFIKPNTKPQKYVRVIVITLAIFSLLASFSRQAFLGVTVASALTIFVYSYTTSTESSLLNRYQNIYFLMILPVIVISTALAEWLRLDSAILHLSMRVQRMISGLNVILERPITGTGVGFSVYIENAYAANVDVATTPHNVFIAVAAQTGLTGFTLFLITAMILISYLVRSMLQNDSTIYYHLLFICVHIIVTGMFSEHILRTDLSLWFAIYASLTIAVVVPDYT